MMNEGVHFDLSFITPFQLGYKLVSVNVSDIYAMGGRPLYLFLDLAMKGETEEEFLWELYDGLAAAMDTYGVKLLGGDLCGVRSDMVLSATVMGTSEKPILRSGASAGDRVYVTGTLGDSACGLEILKRHGVPEGASPLVQRHLMPMARESSSLSRCATAMIDISDGLFIDLTRLCDESGSGVRIIAERLPLSEEMKREAGAMGLDPFHLATAGGEDYELLFTAPADCPVPPEIAGGVRVTCIGEITGGERLLVDGQGRESILRGEGYQHFGTEG